MTQSALSDAKRALLAARLRGAQTDDPAATDQLTAKQPDAGQSSMEHSGVSHPGADQHRAGSPGIPPHGGPPDRPPLSHAQERLWFLEQLTPGTDAWVLLIQVKITGDLDAEALDGALADVLARHAALRTVFPQDQDGAPIALERAAGPSIGLVRKTFDDAHRDERLAAAIEWFRREIEQPFDLAAGPLLRAGLARTGAAEHCLAIAVHHIVCDGYSAEILMRDLWAFYRARTGGGAATDLPALPVSYGDAAAWQRARADGDEGAADLAYWKRQLEHVPALALPTDRPQPTELDYDGSWYRFALDRTLAESVQALARKLRATPFAVLLAAYQTLLGRWCAQEDFAVGTVVAGRGHPQVEDLVGMFANTVAMRANLAGNPAFSRLVARTADAVIEALQRDHVPFERIVTELGVPRDTSRTPVYQATFAYQNYGRPTGVGPGLVVEGLPRAGASTHADLALYAWPDDDGRLSFTFTYRTAIFDETTIAALADRYRALLGQVIENCDVRVGDLRLASKRERALELTEWNGRDLRPAEPALLHCGFVRQAARTPDAVAIVCGTDQATYRELDDASNRIAHRLVRLGVRPDSRVGILLEQSVELAASVLGVLKAGAAYVPLDPQQPAERLSLMLDDARLVALVTTGDAARSASAPHDDVATLLLDDFDVKQSTDPDLALTPPEPVDQNPCIDVDPLNLAYVIYTSGSTGAPKGVAVAHRQASSYLAAIVREIAAEPGDGYLLTQSLSFDFGLTVFYGCLATGGCLHLMPARSSGHEIAEYLRAHRIDHLKLTPSHFEALTADRAATELLPRKTLLFGGEASQWVRTRELAAHGIRMLNHYGPTEATVGVATHEVDPHAEPVASTTPIGLALPGARVYVLDDAMEPVPAGSIGELYLGGDRLARGYLGRPGATADRFVPDPYGPPGSRLYRSGDLGRRLPGGAIEFLGRRDLQVKIRGYRVEPAEIEAALLTLPGIQQTVVDLRGPRAEPELVAYFVGDGALPRPSEADLRAALRDRLPDYMVPARFVQLDAIPLADHGKVDRRALPEPPPRTATAGTAAEGPLEELVTGIFAAVLALPGYGAEDDFFDAGGHSLLGLRVVARLRAALPAGTAPVTVMDLFHAPTPRALASLIRDRRDGAADGRLLHRLTPARRTTRNLVCAPYGGGSALIYLPLAAELPADWALHSIAVPGHELGEQAQPIAQVARACAQEIAGLEGPVVLYGHCGLGVMLTVEIARLLEAAGRPVEAVYLGGIYPFARPGGPRGRLSARFTALRDRFTSDRWMINALIAAGLDVADLDPAQLALIARNRRTGSREAELYFGALFGDGSRPVPLAAPVISVAGERDPATEFYAERFREWHALSATTGLVVLDEAGHFFLRHRAAELADIVTGVHPQVRRLAERESGPDDSRRREHLDSPYARRPGATWWLADVSSTSTAASPPAQSAAPSAARTAAVASAPGGDPSAARPSMARFAAVASGQAVSMIGSALSEFAIPVWVLLHTGSLARFAFFSVVALVPGLLIAPLAGAIVDRGDRRRVMLFGDCAAGAVQCALACLYFTGTLRAWHLYALLTVLSVALTFQRLAYASAVAQLVPKRFLGHANGIVQFTNGIAQFFVPVAALGILTLIGLGGILAIDAASYVFAVAVTACVRFPRTTAWRRRESLGAEIAEGFRYAVGNRGLRAMLLQFAAVNLFLAPLLVMIPPLVLSFAPLRTAALVSTVSGAGLLVGGVVMSIWGGPRRRRMRAMRAIILLFAASGALTGLAATTWSVALGAFGMTLSLALMNGVYATIVLVKVPLRFHGRIFAVNTVIAWSTIPLAAGLLGPLTARFAGIHTVYELFAALIVVTLLAAGRSRSVADFDDLVPDAESDDLVGVAALRAARSADPAAAKAKELTAA
ncbi:MAG TPA: amino acid adenylation domain-containing protein [Actinocrinis sp.]|nr:amino acid adenylation domain-containing protein [Actinocrinis sp.]